MLLLRSPTAGFPVAGSMPRSAPQPLPDRGRSLATAFRSPATAPVSLRLHSRVNVPGLLLRVLPDASAARSTSRSTTDPGLHPRSTASTRSARCRFRTWPGLPPAPASTPLRDRYVPPDQSVLPFRCKPARLPTQPDLRSLPAAARTITRTSGFGSMFPVRYCFGGLLFLKPLGTFLTMLPIAKTVNIFV